MTEHTNRLISEFRRRPIPAWLVLSLYAVSGLGIAVLVPAFKALGSSCFGRSGYGVAIVVNVVLPLFFVVAAAWYPKWSVALPGTFLTILVFMLATGMLPTSLSGDWIGSFRGMEPVFVIACIAYFIISFITVAIVRTMQHIGATPPA
ncbi:MAG: hypothetical protein HY287_00690 [Planctomycetes bacterium]|nr:hypothetical protein [Planctomycetota bacterium]